MKNNHYRKGFILGLLAVLLIPLTIISSRQIHAQAFIGNVLDSLKAKLGFNYSLNSTQPFIFSKETPNYLAFAGDRKSGGDHRIMLEKDGFNIEVIFLSAQSAEIKPASPSPSVILKNVKETSPSAEISKDKEATGTAILLNQDQATSSATVSALTPEENNLINQIQQQMENIDTGLKELSSKIDTLRQDVNQIVSKAKLVEGKRERKVLFNDILIDIDMIYRLNESGIKQEIILKKKDKLKSAFIFILSPENLSYRNLNHDIWYFYDSSGSAMMRLPKSYAKDGNGAISNQVTIQISKQKGQNLMIVNVSTDWLEDPRRAFPITIYTALEVIPERRVGYHGKIPSLVKTERKNLSTSASESAVLSIQTASSSAETVCLSGDCPLTNISTSSAVIASPSSSMLSTPSATLIPISPYASPSTVPLTPVLTQTPTPAAFPTSPEVLLNSEDLSNGGLEEEK